MKGSRIVKGARWKCPQWTLSVLFNLDMAQRRWNPMPTLAANDRDESPKEEMTTIVSRSRSAEEIVAKTTSEDCRFSDLQGGRYFCEVHCNETGFWISEFFLPPRRRFMRGSSKMLVCLLSAGFRLCCVMRCHGDRYWKTRCCSGATGVKTTKMLFISWIHS